MVKIICVGDCGIDYYENIKKTFAEGISFNFADKLIKYLRKINLEEVLKK